MSLNVRGLYHPAKHYSLYKEVSNKADHITIQETHFHKDSTPYCSHKNYPHIFLASTHAKKRGFLMAVGVSVSFSLSITILDPEGRYSILICTINNYMYTLVNVYTTNSH